MERRKKQQTLTAEAWDSVVHHLVDHSPKSLMAARMVLVDGKSQKDVYEQVGLSKQRLSQIVKAITNKLENSKNGWVYVSTWAPANLAKEFQAKIKIAMVGMSTDSSSDE